MYKQTTAALFFVFSCLANLSAAVPVVLKLWPEGAPEKPGFALEPEKRIEPKGPKDVLRLTNVSEPTLTVYRPENANGTSVIVCPGGVYSILAIEHEGTQVCEWLNSLGVTAILLKYRVPVRNKVPGFEPLQDVQRAIGLVRHHSDEWKLNPNRVGILGFSAGGHLAVMSALNAGERTYKFDSGLDLENAVPDFLIPVYPAYLVAAEDPFALVPSVKVTAKAPPVCLVHAHDDKGTTSSSASVLLYLEYKKLGLPAELHVYQNGGHGFGMKSGPGPVSNWPQRVGEWMRAMGFLDPAKSDK